MATDSLDILRKQKVSEGLIRDIAAFREHNMVREEVKGRVIEPTMPFFGGEILEMSAAALLQGENLLLSGSKATGKNVLAENLAWLFGRPAYNISFHVNTDSSSLIGTDTFLDQQVKFRPGPVYSCAVNGGFGILDEINMAKNDAAAVLHATLDYRRMIDVPGYDRIFLDPATRFIATMNYGYAGTRELNEALVSRFLVIDMPELTDDILGQILEEKYPGMQSKAKKALTGMFLDLQLKAQNSEISTKPLDLRGLLASVSLMKSGIKPVRALKMGIVNKSFDVFEKEIIADIVSTRIDADWTASDIFT